MAGDPYEIRVALGTGTAKWKAVGASAGAANLTGPPSTENGLSRLPIKTATGGEIKWSIQFAD